MGNRIVLQRIQILKKGKNIFFVFCAGEGGCGRGGGGVSIFLQRIEIYNFFFGMGGGWNGRGSVARG